MKKILLYSLVLIFSVGLYAGITHDASALCRDPFRPPEDYQLRDCPVRIIHAKISDLSATPEIVTSENFVNISVDGSKGEDTSGNSFGVYLHGEIVDSEGRNKASFTDSYLDNTASFSYSSDFDVSSWANGIYAVYTSIDEDYGEGTWEDISKASIQFEIKRGISGGDDNVFISADKAWVYEGENVSITWGSSSGAQECRAIEGPSWFNTNNSTDGTVSGTLTVPEGWPSYTHTFTVECSFPTASSGVKKFLASILAIVNPGTGGGTTTTFTPVINSFTASPTEINSGETSTLRWDVVGADSCNIDGTSVAKDSGSINVSPTTSKTYTLSCFNLDGTTTDTVNVSVTSTPPPSTSTKSASVDVEAKDIPPKPVIQILKLQEASTRTETGYIARYSDNIRVYWSTLYADFCTLRVLGSKDEDGSYDVSPGALNAGIFGAPVQGEMNLVADFMPPVGLTTLYTVNPSDAEGDINVTLTCSNKGGTSSVSKKIKVFHNFINFPAYVKTSCASGDDTAIKMEPDDEQNIRFDIEWEIGQTNEVINYQDFITSENNYGVADMLPIYFKVDTSNRNPYDIYNKYTYCGNDGPVTVNNKTNYPPTYDSINLYFVQTGSGYGFDGGESAVGECRQTNPSIQTQIHLSWSAINNADHYDVYRVSSGGGGTATSFLDKLIKKVFAADVKIGSTTNLYYNDIFDPALYNTSGNYYIKAIASDGGVVDTSNTVSATTPSSCGAPPPPPGSNDTLVVTPSSATINESSCNPPISKQFDALYDPDGGGGDRYGNFNVNSYAVWSSSKTSVASSQGDGLFNGESSGASTVSAVYRKTGNATLNVNSCGPDFSLLISPELKEVDISNGDVSTDYTISLQSINDFSGDITLGYDGLHAGDFDPQPVSLSGNSEATLTVEVSDDSSTGRSTFTVEGVSGDIAHSDTADINVTDSSLPIPTANITADPSVITPGYSSTLSWETTNATHCEINNGVGVVLDSGAPTDTDGSELVSPPTTRTYTLTCSNSNGDASDSTTVAVNVDPGDDGGLSCSVARYPGFGSSPLNVKFTVSSSGGTSPFTYRLDPDDGSGYTSWQGDNEIYHSYNNAGGYIATAQVQDPEGNMGTCNASVINVISGEECAISASPSSILAGQSSTLSWSCQNPSPLWSCEINEVGVVDPSGGSTKVSNIRETTTYTLNCNGDDKASTTVNVGFIPVLREILPRW